MEPESTLASILERLPSTLWKPNHAPKINDNQAARSRYVPEGILRQCRKAKTEFTTVSSVKDQYDQPYITLSPDSMGSPRKDFRVV